jgi:hypothetical protein
MVARREGNVDRMLLKRLMIAKKAPQWGMLFGGHARPHRLVRVPYTQSVRNRAGILFAGAFTLISTAIPRSFTPRSMTSSMGSKGVSHNGTDVTLTKRDVRNPKTNLTS